MRMTLFFFIKKINIASSNPNFKLLIIKGVFFFLFFFLAQNIIKDKNVFVKFCFFFILKLYKIFEI